MPRKRAVIAKEGHICGFSQWRSKRRETWGGSRPRSALPVLCMAPALPVLKPPRPVDTPQPRLDLSTIEELPETTGTSATRSSTGLPDTASNTSFEGKFCVAIATMLGKGIDLPSSHEPWLVDVDLSPNRSRMSSARPLLRSMCSTVFGTAHARSCLGLWLCQQTAAPS